MSQVTFCNFFFFFFPVCGEEFTPQSNPGLEDHTLQAVRKCVLNTSRVPGPRPGWRRIACVFHLQWLYCGESLLFSAGRYRSAAVLLEHGCTNPGRQAATVAKLCAVAPDICGSSVWNSLHITPLATRNEPLC